MSPTRSRDHRDSREDGRSRDRDREERKDRSSGPPDRRRTSQEPLIRGDVQDYTDKRNARAAYDNAHFSRYGDIRGSEVKPKEQGPEIIPILDVLDPPGRYSRPKQVSFAFDHGASLSMKNIFL